MISPSAFKWGMVAAFLMIIGVLFGMVYAATTEYSGEPIESMGFVIVLLCVAVASGVLLFALREMLKLKSL